MIGAGIVRVAVVSCALAVAPVAAGTTPTPTFPKLVAGDRAPALEATTLAGAEWSLGGLKGKRVVLEFGSVFCIPCRQTLGMMGREVEGLRRRNVELLHLNVDGPGREGTVREFLRKGAPALPAAMDPGEVGRRFGAREIPYLVVIAADGTVAATHVGQPASREEFLKLATGE